MPMTQRLAEILAQMVMASLDAAERRAPRVEPCPGCPYGSETVGSSGNPASPIAIVGEAPGHTEVTQGRPFVGPAGTTLRRAIEEASLGEFDPFITNSVACLPSPVTPRVEAIDACRGRLMRELEAYPRTVVVAVGGTALRALTETRKPRILEARAGPPLKVHGWLVVPTVHPAWVRRDPHEREKLLIGDLWRARGLLDASHLRPRLPAGAPDFARGDADTMQTPSESRPLTRSSLGGESKVTPVSLESGPETPKIAPAKTNSRMADQPRYTCRVASQKSESLAGQIATLFGDWRGRAGSPRRGSAGSKLIELLAHEPIVSVSTAHAAIGGSAEAVRLALNSFTERGIVRQITAGRYARAWAADELFDLLNEYERSFRT